MKKNIGSADKTIRVIIALIFAVMFFTKTVQGTFGYILLVVAFVFLLTSLVGFCPLYALFGINSCKKKNQLNRK
jgi:hypothetical protein